MSLRSTVKSVPVPVNHVLIKVLHGSPCIGSRCTELWRTLVFCKNLTESLPCQFFLFARFSFSADCTTIKTNNGLIFENIVKEKKDFVLYVSLPICNGDAAKFKEFVLDFQHKNKVSFYYLTSDYIKDTSVYETVKYFPSVIIYKDGKIINYLRYDSDEDKEYYKSYDGFSKWLRANVEL